MKRRPPKAGPQSFALTDPIPWRSAGTGWSASSRAGSGAPADVLHLDRAEAGDLSAGVFDRRGLWWPRR